MESPATRHSPPATVYLVDDDSSMLRALSRLLTAAGYEVQAFTAAAEFLDQHQASSRGCVVADLRMPGMSGLDLQSALTRSGNPLPVVFLTGHGDIPTSVRAIKGGAEDFLTKPVKMEDLLAAVGRALARDVELFESSVRQSDLQQRFSLLTPREREVLSHVIAGKLNKEIATELGATERTIKAHRANLMAKLQAHSPAELGHIAQEAGFGRQQVVNQRRGLLE